MKDEPIITPPLPEFKPGVSAIRFRILGEPASKANSRIPKPLKSGKILWIKSEKALAYEEDALRQIPPWARQRLDGPIRITIKIIYASQRPDLDESLILDCLQDRWTLVPTGGFEKDGKPKRERKLIQRGVYRNDKQIDERYVLRGGIDPSNPYSEITVEPLQPQAVDMFAAPIGTTLDPVPAADDDEGGSF